MFVRAEKLCSRTREAACNIFEAGQSFLQAHIRLSYIHFRPGFKFNKSSLFRFSILFSILETLYEAAKDIAGERATHYSNVMDFKAQNPPTRSPISSDIAYPGQQQAHSLFR